MVRHTGEDFVDIECIAVSPMLPLQSTGVKRAKLDTPETDGFSGYSDATFSEDIFNIAVAEIEAIVEPDGVGDDIGWKPMTLICIHAEIVSQTKLIWQYLHLAWFLPVSVN